MPKNLDKCDVYMVVGIGLLGYGLFTFQPWVAFAVVGSVITLIGFFGK